MEVTAVHFQIFGPAQPRGDRESQAPGFNSSLQASIQASKLQFKPPGFNSRFQASEREKGRGREKKFFSLSLEASIQAFRLQFKVPGSKKRREEEEKRNSSV